MGTSTTNYGLYKPAAGEDGWDASVNSGFDTIDGAMGGHGGADPYVNNKMRAWNFDYFVNDGYDQSLTSGWTYALKIPVPKTISVTNIVVGVGVIGVTLTLNQSLVGLYTVSGGTATLAGAGAGTAGTNGVSADQSVVWVGTTGPKAAAVTGGPYTITGGPTTYCYVGLLCVGSTPVKLKQSWLQAVSWVNFGLAASDGYRVGRIATAQTQLPASFTVANLVDGQANIWWGALS